MSSIKHFWQKLYNPQLDKGPITIVSGLPRTGTSLMMKMLEAGGLPPLTDKLRTADADNPQGYYEFEPVKRLPQGDHAWLAEGQGKSVKVIAALLAYLPANYTYRVIFMRRALPEVVASQRVMLLRRGENPPEVDDNAMMLLFQEHLRQVNAWLANQPNIKHLDVDYNQLMADPAPIAGQINQFLDRTLDVEKMAAVIDTKLYRQRGQ